MTKTAISFIIILTAISFISIASALEFTFSSPEEVNLNEEFEILISLDTSDIYDVKAFVQKDTKEYSEIFDGEKWRSPRNFIQDAYPDQKEFKLMSYYSGDTQVCVRLREPEKTSYSEVCNEILVEINEENDPDNDQEDDKEGDEEDKKQVQEKTTQPTNSQELNEPSQTSTTDLEPIILNPQSPAKSQANQPQSNSPTLTTQEKTRTYIIYAFTFFTIVIIILLALRKL